MSVLDTMKDYAVLLEAENAELRALVREVLGPVEFYMGPEGARNCEVLCSRLAESDWFKRARAALTS